MPYDFRAIGWQDWQNNRHYGEPDDLDSVKGIRVEAQDPQNPDDYHQFWAYILEPFEDWAEWWVYIGALMEMHGLSLA